MAQLRQDRTARPRQRSIQRAPASVSVAAAAHPFGARGHVQLAPAAQAHANVPLWQFTQKDRGLDAFEAGIEK